MRLYLDIDTGQVSYTLGGPVVSTFVIYLRDKLPFELVYVQAGAIVTDTIVDGGTNILQRIGLKSVPSGQLLAGTASYTVETAGTGPSAFDYSRSLLSLNSTELINYFADNVGPGARDATMLLEVETSAIDFTSRVTRLQINVTVRRDVLQPTDEDPISANESAGRAETAAADAELAAARAAEGLEEIIGYRDEAIAARDAAQAAQAVAETKAAEALQSASDAATARTAAEAAQEAAELAQSAAALARTAAEAAQTAAEQSASDAADSATSAAAAQLAAEAAQIAAEAAYASAAASEAAALSAATAAANSAAAAAASQSAASTSATAAAASALTASQILAGQYRGGYAGNAVPATLANAGDYFRATSGGTSQGQTWVTGDIGVWIGVSGSYTRLSGILPLATDAEARAGTETGKANTPASGNARALLGDISRRVSDVLFFDGVTNARVFWPLVAAGNVGAGDFTIVIPHLRIPTANPASSRALVGLTDTSSGSQGTGVRLCPVLEANGSLSLYLYNPDFANRRTLTTSGNLVSAYGGQEVTLVYGRSAGAFFAFVNGGQISISASTPIGANAPAENATLAASFLVAGGSGMAASGWQGQMGVPVLVNRAWSAADALYHAQTGRLPESDAIGVGRPASTYASDFSGGVDSWVHSSAPGLTLTGNIDGIGGVEDTLRVTATTAELLQLARLNTIQSARRQVLSFDYYAEAGCGVGFIGLGAAGSKRNIENNVAVVEGSWQVVTLTQSEVFASTSFLIAGFTTPTGSGGATLAVGKSIYLKNCRVTPIGPVVRAVAQPGCAVLTDSGTHGIPGILTPGVTVVGDWPESIAIPSGQISADGFVLADQVIVPAGYELVRATLTRVSGSYTGAVTVRETSSGGSIVATGNAAAGTVSLTISNALLVGGKKLHVSGITGNGTFRLRFRLERTSLN